MESASLTVCLSVYECCIYLVTAWCMQHQSVLSFIHRIGDISTPFFTVTMTAGVLCSFETQNPVSGTASVPAPVPIHRCRSWHESSESRGVARQTGHGEPGRRCGARETQASQKRTPRVGHLRSIVKSVLMNRVRLLLVQ